jgi:hypothetical protein
MPPLDAIVTLLLASETNRKNQQKKKHRFISWKEKGEWREKNNKKGCSTHHLL